MNFHLHIKFRAFGITLGTVDKTFSGTVTVTEVLTAALSVIAAKVPAAALLTPGELLSLINVAPHVIYDDRGILLEVVA